MDIKELNKKLQFEFMKKHYKATRKADNANSMLQKIPAYKKLCKIEKELIFEVAKDNLCETNIEFDVDDLEENED